MCLLPVWCNIRCGRYCAGGVRVGSGCKCSMPTRPCMSLSSRCSRVPCFIACGRSLRCRLAARSIRRRAAIVRRLQKLAARFGRIDGPDVQGLRHSDRRRWRRLVERGLDVRLTLIGDGKFREPLESLAGELHVAERVTWLGQLPAGEAIRRELDEADLFVLPSRTEGLPRAVVEAMARGLPCIASRVGGIPELLADENLIAAGDVAALTRGRCNRRSRVLQSSKGCRGET